jgi:hypothetical protein
MSKPKANGKTIFRVVNKNFFKVSYIFISSIFIPTDTHRTRFYNLFSIKNDIFLCASAGKR